MLLQLIVIFEDFFTHFALELEALYLGLVRVFLQHVPHLQESEKATPHHPTAFKWGLYTHTLSLSLNTHTCAPPAGKVNGDSKSLIALIGLSLSHRTQGFLCRKMPHICP